MLKEVLQAGKKNVIYVWNMDLYVEEEESINKNKIKQILK